MSKLTDKISYLRGLADGIRLNPEVDVNRLVLGILDVLDEVGSTCEALADAHGELRNYVESIDEDLADLEEDIFGSDQDDPDRVDDEEDDEVDGNDEEDTAMGLPHGPILYECPHCHTTVEIDPDSVDFNEDALCPACGKELFPETLEK